jgi:hypothetical protein
LRAAPFRGGFLATRQAILVTSGSPSDSQLEARLLLALEYHLQVACYARGIAAAIEAIFDGEVDLCAWLFGL